MMEETILVKDEIQGIEFEVIIALEFKLAKILINGEPWYIHDVDLAQVIRAIVNSKNLYELRENVEGIWGDEKLQILITNYINGDF